MKKIGVVVCNYNKREYVIKCVNSILKQSIQDMDIYVVDNASPDDSVLKLKQEFDQKITLIENKENLGGSGGFNTGLREALKQEYQYLMLADNDIIMDTYAIEALSTFLDEHEDVAMVGSEIYKMDQPDTIMALGSLVDYEKYKYQDCYRGYHRHEGLVDCCRRI